MEDRFGTRAFVFLCLGPGGGVLDDRSALLRAPALQKEDPDHDDVSLSPDRAAPWGTHIGHPTSLSCVDCFGEDPPDQSAGRPYADGAAIQTATAALLVGP